MYITISRGELLLSILTICAVSRLAYQGFLMHKENKAKQNNILITKQ